MRKGGGRFRGRDLVAPSRINLARNHSRGDGVENSRSGPFPAQPTAPGAAWIDPVGTVSFEDGVEGSARPPDRELRSAQDCARRGADPPFPPSPCRRGAASEKLLPLNRSHYFPCEITGKIVGSI